MVYPDKFKAVVKKYLDIEFEMENDRYGGVQIVLLVGGDCECVKYSAHNTPDEVNRIKNELIEEFKKARGIASVNLKYP